MFCLRLRVLVVALASALVVSCGTDRAPAPQTSEDLPTPSDRFVTVNGVRLHYLDWGGTGDGLVFLHGLGDSPHAFDHIAPVFRDRFHVLAATRRAHGQSAGSEGPFDNSTLVEDLKGLLDSLRIDRVALAGWSLGGNEMTEFAVRYPDRVIGLVYLDCYDLGDPAFGSFLQTWPVSTTATPEDLASMDAFRAWWKRLAAPSVPWTPAMDAMVTDLVDIQADGSVTVRLSDSLTAAFFSEGMAFRPDYGAIKAPILAIFARWDAESIVGANAPDTIQRRVETWFQEQQRPWQEEAIQHFRSSAPGAEVVVLEHTGHAALPFQARDTIVAAMRRFLTERPEK